MLHSGHMIYNSELLEQGIKREVGLCLSSWLLCSRYGMELGFVMWVARPATEWSINHFNNAQYFRLKPYD